MQRVRRDADVRGVLADVIRAEQAQDPVRRRARVGRLALALDVERHREALRLALGPLRRGAAVRHLDGVGHLHGRVLELRELVHVRDVLPPELAVRRRLATGASEPRDGDVKLDAVVQRAVREIELRDVIRGHASVHATCASMRCTCASLCGPSTLKWPARFSAQRKGLVEVRGFQLRLGALVKLHARRLPSLNALVARFASASPRPLARYMSATPSLLKIFTRRFASELAFAFGVVATSPMAKSIAVRALARRRGSDTPRRA